MFGGLASSFWRSCRWKRIYIRFDLKMVTIINEYEITIDGEIFIVTEFDNGEEIIAPKF